MTQTKQPKTASKFTPGPYEAKQAGPNLWIYAGDVAVAFIGGRDTPFTLHPNTPHKANARLFWKAPEMYELLEMLNTYHTRIVKNPSSLPSLKIALDEFPTASDIYQEARRIKAEIDGEG